MTTSITTGSSTAGPSDTPAAVPVASPAAGPARASDAPATAAAAIPGRSDGPDSDETAAVPQPEFDRLEDWLAGYFLPMFRRTLGGEYRWCRQWWRHGEAISRLTALWHAWEVLRTQPATGIATWYREHLDHQLPVLLGARGPFYQCSEDTHREPHQAAADPAPAGWWHPAAGPGDHAADGAGTGRDGERDDGVVTEP